MRQNGKNINICMFELNVKKQYFFNLITTKDDVKIVIKKFNEKNLEHNILLRGTRFFLKKYVIFFEVALISQKFILFKKSIVFVC